MSAGDTLRERAARWAVEDPDPHTQAQLLALLDAIELDTAMEAELADAFDHRLQFGTAGLRGAMGPGPNRMNLVVVMQAAAGLADYLGPGGAVVIGYDARHHSDTFARAIAQVLMGAGISAMVLPSPLPTPVLAYAIRELGCAAGVMVTASHNPPNDNGMKVYLDDGIQIVPPADAEISARIAAWAERPLADIPLGEEWFTLGDDIVVQYVERTARLALEPPPTHPVVVYTPMHGVGGEVFESVLEEAGYPLPIQVAAQYAPDPEFPTVAFPNPEEPGAMDLALEAARATSADLVIAHDPDADRCAVAVPDDTGHWRALTGDEVGALLATWMIHRGVEFGTFAQSIVSCSLLEAIAESEGLGYAQTLTGFKWIARVPGLAFGYEEALGYCVDPEAVSDKDGISAALLVVEMAAHLKHEGRSVLDLLDDIALEHGVYATTQVSLRANDLTRIAAVMDTLRATPPTEIAGHRVICVDDLERPTELPPTNGLRFIADGDIRVIIRPSGTEPKVKAYLQVTVPVVDGDLGTARTIANDRLANVRAAVAAWLG